MEKKNLFLLERMTPLIGCAMLKTNPLLKHYIKFYFMIAFYEAKYIVGDFPAHSALRSSLPLTAMCWQKLVGLYPVLSS